jgi:predicted permease
VVRGKPFKAHTLAYAVAIVAGVFTVAYFLSMNIPQLVKILVSILVGMALIVLGAYIQRRRQEQQDRS